MLYLAAAIAKMPDTQVTVLNEFPEITSDRLSAFFNIDLRRVRLRSIRNHSSDLREIVAGADFFIPQSNFHRVNASPKNYVQVLQVPYGRITPISVLVKMAAGKFRDAAKDILRSSLISNAKRNSRLTLSNSMFVRETLLRNFGLESTLLYAPVQDLLEKDIKKDQIILSVGRFFRGVYNNKRYDMLTQAFRMLSKSLPGWEYHLVGSVSSNRESQNFLTELQDANRGYPVFFHTNVSHKELKEFYNRATFYWHGAGYGVDEMKHPEATEHFGMSVLEAMTAGCIPIVVNKGGLKETVRHEENGFLWDTLDELSKYTFRAANSSPDWLEARSRKGREEYEKFSPDMFDRRVRDIFLPMFNMEKEDA